MQIEFRKTKDGQELEIIRTVDTCPKCGQVEKFEKTCYPGGSYRIEFECGYIAEG